MATKNRCEWCLSDPLYIDYHDHEWGVPIYDDLKLFEFLMLEGMQAGLSWLTILKKRENFRDAFDQFNPEKITRYRQKKIDQLMNNSGIIRNRLKIQAIIQNADAYLELKNNGIDFNDYLWQFVDHTPIINHHKTIKDNPTHNKVSDLMAKDLKQHGFKFVGTTICYAFMQAIGMVNDHTISCFRYSELADSVTA